MFCRDYCKICKSTNFEEHLHTAASENNKKRFVRKATSHNHYNKYGRSKAKDWRN